MRPLGTPLLRAPLSPLDRALEQRRDDLALEQREEHEGGQQDQDRAGAQRGDVGRVVALEGSQRTGHGSLRRVLDEHECDAELFHVQADMRIPSEAIDARASGRWMRLITGLLAPMGVVWFAFPWIDQLVRPQ